MADLVDTMTMSSMTTISAEPASASRWSETAGETRQAFPALMGSISLSDKRPSDVAREEGVANQ